MNRVNPTSFPVIFGVIAFAITAALGFFVYQSYTKFSEVSAEYDAQVSRLHSLQNRSPFPSKANLEKVQSLTEAYRTQFDSFVAEVSKMNHPLEELTPQEFQDRLRSVVSAVQAAAVENKVALPEDFYMGFDRYRGELPPDRAAGPLGRQLSAIQFVVEKTIDLRANAILGIQRDPLPEEGPPPAGDSEVPVLQAFPFSIQFVAEQGRARQILNSIVGSGQFFVLRSLNITNSATEGPSRSGDASTQPIVATPAEDDPFALFNQQAGAAADEASTAAGLNVLVGRESLLVDARIEIIAVNAPASGTESK